MQQDLSRDEINFIEARIKDKIRKVKKTQTIQFTDFLDLPNKRIVENMLHENNYHSYMCFGGNDEFDRCIVILYPEDMKEEITKKINEVLSIIKIKLPAKTEKYEHRIYLSGMMKLGIKREKFGDIHVFDDGAEIIVMKDISEYCIMNLKNLTRFKGCSIEHEKIENLRKKELKFEELKYIISSNRLDSFVAECAKTSRNKACELIENDCVLVNMRQENKKTRHLNEGDTLTIRRKGKFILERFEKTTKSGRIQVIMKKYI